MSRGQPTSSGPSASCSVRTPSLAPHSSHLLPLNAKSVDEASSIKDQYQPEACTVDGALGMAEDDIEAVNNCFDEQGRQSREQRPVASHLGKRRHETTPDEDVIEVSPPQKKHRPTAAATTNSIAPATQSQTSKKPLQQKEARPLNTMTLQTQHTSRQSAMPTTTDRSANIPTKTRKRPRDITAEEPTDSDSAPQNKRQRGDAVSPERTSTTTTNQGSRVAQPGLSSNKVSASFLQQGQGPNAESGPSRQQHTSAHSKTEDEGTKNTKPKEGSAPKVAAANPIPQPISSGFRNKRPETAEDRRQIALAIAYTYDDLISRKPELKRDKMYIEKDRKTGEEIDTTQGKSISKRPLLSENFRSELMLTWNPESYGYQWNRLQHLFQEACDNASGVEANPKSRRKTKKQKQAAANR